MRKKFELYLNSFKASACTKPTAFAMMIIIIISVTVTIGLPSRAMVNSLDSIIYSENIVITNKSNRNSDYSNYKELGDLLFDSINKGLCDKIDSKVHINMILYNCSIVTEENKTVKIDDDYVKFVVKSPYFTSEEITLGSQIMAVSSRFVAKYGLRDGEKITYFDREFTIRLVDMVDDDIMTIFIPYKAELKGFLYGSSTELGKNIMHFNSGSATIFGKTRELTFNESNSLAKLGYKQYIHLGFLYSIMGLLVILVIGSAVNVLAVSIYFQKANSRKFTIYKIIGAKPLNIAGMMIAETTILTSIAIAVGVLLEYILALIFYTNEIMISNRIYWLHILIMSLITIFTVIGTVMTNVVKQSRAKPADPKYLV